MASTSSMNSNSSGSLAPNPPPRTHSRPTQPPPPPPLPAVPPVPPNRDSSITMAKSTLSRQNTNGNLSTQTMASTKSNISYETNFIDKFDSLFKSLDDLPPPDPFVGKPKSYPSQKAQQKQMQSSNQQPQLSISPSIHS